MESKEINQIKLLMLVGVIIVAVLIVMFIAVNISNLDVYFGNAQNSSNLPSSYEKTSSITKVEVADKLSPTNIKSNILLEQNKLIHVSGTSILTTKVTNVGITKDNIRYKIKFILYDGSTIIEIMAFVGKIKANEIKYVDSYITTNLSNLKDITYEIIQ